MSLLNLLVKIGTDIFTKPDSNAAQVTQYVLKNPQLMKEGAKLVTEAYKGLLSIMISNLNRNSARNAAQNSYNTRITPISQQEKQAFSHLARESFKNNSFSSLKVDFFACREGSQTYIGTHRGGNLLDIKKANYNTIDSTFDKELNQKELLTL